MVWFKLFHVCRRALTIVPGASSRLHDDSTKGKRKADPSPEDGDGPKKRKRNVKPKDPNAPKRPASSYILFQNEVRKDLKEQHPELSNSDLLGLISEQWKHMSEEQKEVCRVLNVPICMPPSYIIHARPLSLDLQPGNEDSQGPIF